MSVAVIAAGIVVPKSALFRGWSGAAATTMIGQKITVPLSLDPLQGCFGNFDPKTLNPFFFYHATAYDTTTHSSLLYMFVTHHSFSVTARLILISARRSSSLFSSFYFDS